MNRQLNLPYLAVAAIAGVVFGVGLYISGMVNPLKVLRFLDFVSIPRGHWDPSLALVMVGAIAVFFVAVRVGRRLGQPAFDVKFYEPEFTRIDPQLVFGSAIFGIGWGMSGICPGPAISLIAFWPQYLPVYLLALFVGSYGASIVIPSDRRLAMAR
jgi:hypothetical protein